MKAPSRSWFSANLGRQSLTYCVEAAPEFCITVAQKDNTTRTHAVLAPKMWARVYITCYSRLHRPICNTLCLCCKMTDAPAATAAAVSMIAQTAPAQLCTPAANLQLPKMLMLLFRRIASSLIGACCCSVAADAAALICASRGSTVWCTSVAIPSTSSLQPDERNP